MTPWLVDDPKLARHIRVVPGKGVEIDGQEFPWYLTEDGVGVSVGSRRELTWVTIQIPCETVEVVDPDLQANERTHMHDGEQHTHEETVKDEHQTEDGRVETEVTEKTEAEKPAEDE